MSADFDAVAKIWYIMGDKGCSQVSSKSCVSFRRREQIPILGGENPFARGDPLMSADFDAVDKLWYIMRYQGCGQVSSKSVDSSGLQSCPLHTNIQTENLRITVV